MLALALSTLSPTILAASMLGAADVTVDYRDSHAWSGNVGWINFNHYSFGIDPNFLRGYIWGENIGWINCGDGSPSNGFSYGNMLASDYGVNILPGGDLTGLAWSANCGWIDFGGGAMATPPVPARLNIPELRFEGYVWSENIGWINLGTDRVTLRLTLCPADFDSNQFVDDADFVIFAQQYDEFACADLSMPGGCIADLNGDGFVDDADFVYFAAAYADFLCP